MPGLISFQNINKKHIPIKVNFYRRGKGLSFLDIKKQHKPVKINFYTRG